MDNESDKSGPLEESMMQVEERNTSNEKMSSSETEMTSGILGTSKSGAALPCAADPGAVTEQFQQLAKGAKGAAAVQLIKEALEAPGLYVFAELLHMPNIKELSDSTEHAWYYRLMEIFAYGVYDDYLQNKATLPPLTPAMLTKLRHLTIVTLASNQKTLPLETLVNKLSLNTRRELEDLIIEAVYADVLHGKLDQKNGVLEVEYALGRDIKPEDLPQISATLKAWCDTCTSMLGTLEGLATQANKTKEANLWRAKNIEVEISKIKSTYSKRQMAGEGEDCMAQADARDKYHRMRKNGSTNQSSGAGSSKSFSKFPFSKS